MVVNLARMGVRMKTLFTLLVMLSFLRAYSQVRDSALIDPHIGNQIVVTGKKILLNGSSKFPYSELELLYFNGLNWVNISQETIPFKFSGTLKFTPSEFSDKIYIPTIKHLWEFDGKNWIPHSIKDSLDGIRNFDEIIELPDSSLVLFSTHYVKRFDSTSSDSIIINYKELQKFKDGKFTTLKSIQFDIKSIYFYSKYMYGLKKHINGSFSFTAYNLNPQKVGNEILTFSPDGQLLRSDRYPDLTPFGYDQVGGYVKFQDYLFDSKGSFWHLVGSQSLIKQPGLVEVTQNGEIFIHNEIEGLPRTRFDDIPSNFDVDENDNILFYFVYNVEQLPDGKVVSYPSIFKFHADRKNLTEFLFEDIRENSIWYNGGDTQEKLYISGSLMDFKYHQGEKSILLPYADGVRMLQFFPGKVLATVKEQLNNPIQLYPNPVQTGNIVTIESVLFEKVNNPLSVVIRDISGATVRENVISAIGNLLSIKTEGLSHGTYFVSVLNNNKIILQTNFVKE